MTAGIIVLSVIFFGLLVILATSTVDDTDSVRLRFVRRR